MSEKYIQIAGKSKGQIVEIVEEEPNKIVVKGEHNFHYGVSKKDFEKYYMLLSEWEEKNKKAGKSDDKKKVEQSDASTRGEVPLKD